MYFSVHFSMYLSVHFSMDFSIEKCITFELDFIRSKMKGWKVRIKKFAVFWVRHRKVLTLLFCPSCPTSGKPPLKFGLIGEVYWVYWHSEIWASDTFKRIQKNASPKLTKNDEWRTRHAREFGDIPLALSGNLLTAPPTRVDRIMQDGYLESCKLYSVNFVEIFMKICIKIAFRPSAPP